MIFIDRPGDDKILNKIRKQQENNLPQSAGTKHDDSKPPIALIPYEALWEEAKVMGFGEKKYGTWNWAQGLSYIRLCSAAMRHVLQFLMGNDDDEETGLSHLAHARCCLGMVLWMNEHRKDMDDRRKS